MTDATRSIAIHVSMSQTLAEMETDIVTDLCSRLMNNRLTHDAAIAGIAQIAALRNLEHVLDSRARRDIAKQNQEL